MLRVLIESAVAHSIPLIFSVLAAAAGIGVGGKSLLDLRQTLASLRRSRKELNSVRDSIASSEVLIPGLNQTLLPLLDLEPGPPDLEPQVRKRLSEAAILKKRMDISARLYSFMAGLLAFVQYVIAGVLASSFMQQTLPSNVIGSLGVFVLMASLISRHFHPEVSSQAARRAAHKLDSVIRENEDRLAAINAGAIEGNRADLMLKLLDSIGTTMNEVAREQGAGSGK